MSGTSTLEFHIKAKAEAQNMFTLEVFQRGSSQPLANTSFEYDVSFLTAYDVSNLDSGKVEPGIRFEKLKSFGSVLYNRLFTKEIGDVWRNFKEKEDFVTLCIRISREVERLELLPWETLYDGREFIAAGACTGLTRLPLDISIKTDLPALSYPLKMLALLSSPLDLEDDERLNLEKEQEILLRGVNFPAGQGRLLVDFEDEAQLPIIENALETPYPLFHFSGHGIDPKSGGGLLLEDMGGKKRVSPVGEVMETLEKGIRHFRLAVIVGCYTACTLYASGFQDLARALARKGVPGVLAMQFSISDRGGIMLAEHLYPKLAEGQPVDKALSAIRRMMLQVDDPVIRGDAFAMVLFLGGEDILKAVEDRKKTDAREIRIEFDKLTMLPELRFGFYGRRKEYRMIRDGILYKHERAVIVHGIGGIGKTALIEHVASRLQGNFDGVCEFDCRGVALSPDVILLRFHRVLEGKGIKVLEQLMHRFFPAEELGAYVGQVLSQVSLLVIFDNFETQLSEILGSPETLSQKGFWPPEAKVNHTIRDQNLKTFLEVLVRTTAERSCFLFTSRYWFDIDEKRVGPIRYMALNDLSRPEALGLMQHLPSLSAASYEDKMEAYRVFGGHPYGLVTVDRHCGMRSLAEVLKDARGVHKELREFLAIEMNYGKLTSKGRELLNRLAAFRQPVEWDAVHWVMGIEEDMVGEFMKRIKKVDPNEIPEELRQMDEAALAQMFKEMLPEQRNAEGMEPVVQELVGWGMVTPVREEEGVYLTVHSLVREFCREKCREEWRKHLIETAGYYTNKYKLFKEEQKTLATVLEEVEAAELLMEAGDAEAAAGAIINIHSLLDRWGWGRLLESLYEQVLRVQPGIERRTRAMILHSMAELMQARGNAEAALEKYEESLKIVGELGIQIGVADSLHNIGAIYHEKGDYVVAIEKYEQSLKIREDIDDKLGISQSLHQLGNIHYLQGNFTDALEKYEQSLKILEELGDRYGIAKSLFNIGNIHYLNGDHVTALENYERSLMIREEIGDKLGIAQSLHLTGGIYLKKGDYANAFNLFESSLKLKEELNDKLGIAQSYGQLGLLFLTTGKYANAFECLMNAMAIFTELESPGTSLIIEKLNQLRNVWGEDIFDSEFEKKTGRKWTSGD